MSLSANVSDSPARVFVQTRRMKFPGRWKNTATDLFTDRHSRSTGVDAQQAETTAMPPKSAPQLAPEQIEEVKEAFNLFDVDSSGAISYKELRACMKALQIKVDKDELKKMILEVDADQSGEIEFPEFLTMMTGKMAQNDSKDEILKVYKMFDVDGDGAITFASLKRVARVRSPRPPALSCRATPFPLPRVPPSRALLCPLRPIGTRALYLTTCAPPSANVCRSWASR